MYIKYAKRCIKMFKGKLKKKQHFWHISYWIGTNTSSKKSYHLAIGWTSAFWKCWNLL